jgi:hypothetical protein
MSLNGKLKHHWSIVVTMHRDKSTLGRYDDRHAYVGQRRIPVSAFEHIDKDRLYVGDSGSPVLRDGRSHR